MKNSKRDDKWWFVGLECTDGDYALLPFNTKQDLRDWAKRCGYLKEEYSIVYGTLTNRGT